MMKKLPTDQNEGNLFTICIPEKEHQKFQYRAHPFGKVCKCHDKAESRSILDKLQKGILNRTTQCNYRFGCNVPQYRIYTPMLQKGLEQGVKIYMQSPIPRSQRARIRETAACIAKEIARDNTD